MVAVPNTTPARPPHRSGRLLVVALAVALLAAACSSPTSSGAAAPPAASASVNLKGVCPDPVVVQTSWYPQSEHGAVYQLVGSGATIDAAVEPSTPAPRGPLTRSSTTR